MNGHALTAAIFTRLLFVVFTALVWHWRFVSGFEILDSLELIKPFCSMDLTPRVERKVTEHFDQFLLTSEFPASDYCAFSRSVILCVQKT